MNPRKNRVYLTLGEKVITSFWVSLTKDGGISFGPSLDETDLHVTVWEKEGKFRYHIRHKGIKEPSDESPIGGQRSTKIVLGKIERMLKKRLKKYHGNKSCWTFTPFRWEKMKSVFPRVDAEGNLYVPLEFIFAKLDMDFSKRNLWRRIKIRTLGTTEPYFGFVETKHGVRLVKPISRNALLAWPLSKADEIQQYFFREIGIDDFFSYLKHTRESKKFWAEAKDRIEQMRDA